MTGGKTKNKQNANTKQSVSNKQAYQRMNYLYQISNSILTQRLQAQLTTLSVKKASEMEFDSSKRINIATPETQVLDSITRRLNSTLRNVAQRLQIRLSTDIKRSLCRDCNSILRPGTGNGTTAVTQRDTMLEITCTACSRIKRFPLVERAPKDKNREFNPRVLSERRKKQRARLKRRRNRIKEQALIAKKMLSVRAVGDPRKLKGTSLKVHA